MSRWVTALRTPPTSFVRLLGLARAKRFISWQRSQALKSARDALHFVFRGRASFSACSQARRRSECPGTVQHLQAPFVSLVQTALRFDRKQRESVWIPACAGQAVS
jgi:hypothetical protein